MCGAPGVDCLRRSTSLGRHALDMSVTVEQQPAIARPVGSLDPSLGHVDSAAVAGSDRHDLQRAIKLGSGMRVHGGNLQIDIGEYSLLHRVLVVAANTDSYVIRTLDREARGTGRHLERLALARQEVKIIS